MNAHSSTPNPTALRSRLLILLGLGAALALLAVACGKKDEGRRVETPAQDMSGGPGASGGLPEGHPPIDGSTPGGTPVDPSALPLKETGSGSLAELERGRAATKVAEAAAAYDKAFRLTFTSDQNGRDYEQARTLFNQAIALDQKYAEAYRGLAYAEFNIGFNKEAALANYMKAIELKPDYGEAHYALAFMYAMDNTEKGAEYFKKAMELGIADERELGPRFYPQVKIPTH
jgi:tetratricopeptide (TPR) repeat protein